MQPRLFTIGLFFALLSVRAAEPLVSTDFGDARSLREIDSAKPEQISGVLPEGVLEDSAWSAIRVTYTRREDTLGGEGGWIEARLQGGERGQAQLKWTLPALREPGRYRLQTTLAARENAAVTFSLRGAKPPYRAHWQQTFRPAAFRQTLDADFALPAIDEEVVLLAQMGRGGVIDLYKLTLFRRGEAEIAAEREALLANAPANLLPAAGFALGLPSGWSTGMTDSLLHDIRVEPATEISPRGTVPLRLATRHADATLELFSPPLPVLVRELPHTLSFFLRGTLADGSVSVDLNRKPLASAILPSSPGEWRRVHLTFTPDAVAPWHVLHLRLKGDIEIDSLMLRTGEEPAEFVTQAACEIALGTDPLKNHVLIAGVDEPLLRWAVTGPAADAQLRLIAIDFFGEARLVADLPLGDNVLNRGAFSLAEVFADKPYGPLRIEAVVLRDGERISPPAERVIHRLRPPRGAGEASRFGGHFHPYEPHLHSARAIGMNWVRLHGPNGRHVYWSAVEPKPGEWRFHREPLQRYVDAGFHIVGSWLHCPGWARIQRQTNNGWLDNWWQPRDLNEFGEYIRRVTEAHKDQIRHWQIWNEPWGDFWFKEWRPDLGPQRQWYPGDEPEKDYAALSRFAYDTGKKTAPGISVLGINATIGERGKNWMRKMMDHDADAAADIFTFHAYSAAKLRNILGNGLEDLGPRIEARVLAPLRAKHGDISGKPIWLTEGNALRSGPDSGHYRHTLHRVTSDPGLLRENSQALAAYHLVCFSKGVDKVFTYAQNAVESHYFVKEGIYWGALGMPGGELNPEASVFAAMTWHLESTTFAERWTSPAGVQAFVFARDGGGSVAALLAAEPLLSPIRPAGAQFRDCFGNDLGERAADFGTIVWAESPDSPAALLETLKSLLP